MATDEKIFKINWDVSLRLKPGKSLTVDSIEYSIKLISELRDLSEKARIIKALRGVEKISLWVPAGGHLRTERVEEVRAETFEAIREILLNGVYNTMQKRIDSLKLIGFVIEEGQ